MAPLRGWMPDIQHVPTTAFGYMDVAPGGMQAVAVMSHIIQGYQRTMVAWAEERPWTLAKSAQFTIGREGRIVQHVSVYDPAWTAGAVREPTWALLPQGANPNKVAVHIEHEGFSEEPTTYPADYVYDREHPWPAAMVAASIDVHRWVFDQLDLTPALDTVIGHYMTDAVMRANDPGEMWPRNEIIDGASGRIAEVPPRLGITAAMRRAAWGAAKGIGSHRLDPLDDDGIEERHILRFPSRRRQRGS